MNAVTLHGALNSANIAGQIKIGGFGDEAYPEYTGEYTVEPNFETQELETQNKVLRQNVFVNPIRVERVSNPYGTTVYIGGIIDG